MNKHKKQEGQIVVILAVAMVAILAVTALAVDGSLVYNDRRADQSTSDSAALAGAGAAAQILKDHKPKDFYCGSSLGAQVATAAVNAAIQAAQLEDGVTLASQDLTTGNGVQTFCGVDTYGMKYLDVKTVVSSETQTFFAKAIGRDTLQTSVQSVARVYPKQPFAYGNGLVSLSPDCGTKSGGIEFGGGSFTYINEAGVFSNSCIKATSSATKVEVHGGGISYRTTCQGCDTADLTPPAQPAPVSLPTDLMPPPKCKNTPFVNAPTSGTINPGNYNKISTGNGDKLVLNPGLYCIKNGLENNSKSELFGDKVTLYIMGGDITINQNAEGAVDLAATSCEVNCTNAGDPPAIRGLLMYVDPSYNATIKLNGGATNKFFGTIYAPKANITLNGSAENSTFDAQVIGWWIEVTGNGQLLMDLDDAGMVQKPSSLSLIK